jgi:hypothetical protein
MADIDVPVISITATTYGPTTSTEITINIPAIIRRATIRRGPRGPRAA